MTTIIEALEAARKHEGRADDCGALARLVIAALAAARDQQPVNQYFYKQSGCPAKDASDPQCVCWWDEGTGPYENERHDAETPMLAWRVKHTAPPAPSVSEQQPQQPDCCVHGVRYPHECKECLHAASPAQDAEDAARAIEWPKSRDVARMGDMTPPGRSYLRVMLDCDNDVCVEIWDQENDRHGSRAGVEFCTYIGGGRSQRTREALIALMVAIEQDNAETPAKAWPPIDAARGSEHVR